MPARSEACRHFERRGVRQAGFQQFTSPLAAAKMLLHPAQFPRKTRRSEMQTGLRILLLMFLSFTLLRGAIAADPWVVYEGGDGPGKGKHIVLVSGDEEYRSEEALPQLGKILAKQHGFKCTVLFAIDKKDGTINPDVRNNIPGLDALKSADLMVIATRMRDLPDDQMKSIVEYLDAGKPIVAMRTATHAFDLK